MQRHPQRHRLAGAGAGRRGTAAIEFALIAPMLLILLTGMVELGMAAFQSMQVQAAAEAGALYAAKHGSTDLAGIAQAVTAATGTAGITATPAPVGFCGCPTAAGVASQGGDCATLCPDGKKPGSYVTVSAQIARTVLLSSPYFSLSLPGTFSGRSVIRTQ